MSKNLTDKFVNSVKPKPNNRFEIPDSLVVGLYLVIHPTGRKSWACRFRTPIDSRPAKLSIGPYPAVSLSKAREIAREKLILVASGKDPRPQKASSNTSFENVTFEVLLDQFLSSYVEPRNRPSTAKEYARIIRREVLPKLGKRKIQAITRHDILDLIDHIKSRAPILANRTLAILSSFFNWAISRGYVEATPTAHVKPPSPEKSRDRILSDDEIRLFLQATIKLGWPFGHLFQLLLLTGQRRDEVASMRWSELDLASPSPRWTLERARTKNGKVHILPITPTTRSILLSAHPMTGGHDFVFTTNGKNPVSGFSKAKRNLDILMKELAGASMSSWTLHDLRRTAASLMARIGQPVHVVEAVLNHKSGKISGVAAVYNRYEYLNEKQQALEALDSFLGQLGFLLPFPEALNRNGA